MIGWDIKKMATWQVTIFYTDRLRRWSLTVTEAVHREEVSLVHNKTMWFTCTMRPLCI